MEIGSIVECIDASGINPKGDCAIPIKGNFYTIKGVVEKPRGLGLYLEECSDLILVNYRHKKRIEHIPFMQSRFRVAHPSVVLLFHLSNKLVKTADNKLDWMLFKFEQKLNLQMLKLQFGSRYVNDIIDGILIELGDDPLEIEFDNAN